MHWNFVVRTSNLPAAVSESLLLSGWYCPARGAFGDCMTAFLSRDLGEPLLEFIASGRPLIGLCVGMQMLFEHSVEFGSHAGLGIIPGKIEVIPKVTSLGTPQKIPHIGWNSLSCSGSRRSDPHGPGTILEGVSPGETVYFVHSYTAWPSDPRSRLADASYGGHRIAAAVRQENVSGTQFHPEKSGRVGLRMLTNFMQQ